MNAKCRLSANVHLLIAGNLIKQMHGLFVNLIFLSVLTERQNNGFVSRSLIGGIQRDFREALNLDVRLNVLSVRQGLPGISNNQALGTNLRSDSRTISAALSGKRPLWGFISPILNLAVKNSQSRYRDPEGEIGLGRQDNDDRTTLAGHYS